MDKTDVMKPSQMSERQFVETFGSVYEHSPWIAQEAFKLGLKAEHDDAPGLSGLMASAVAAASNDKRLELLRAHPDLAGRLAQRGELTASSVDEQSGAGLDQCSPEEFSLFQDLNDRYTAKFGFPFIIAVRDHKRPEILRIFEERMENSIEAELAAALAQVNRIAALRIGLILAG
jgi:OHCU decarboxylase